MSQCARLVLLAFAVSTAHAVLAADALVPVAVPPEFGVAPTRSTTPVVYAESRGEFRNPIDRAVIEAQCEVARKAGMTDKTPVFEAGHDKPIKTEARRYGNETHTAHYSVIHQYQCSRSTRAASSVEALCGCTYRVQPRLTVQIKNRVGGRLEIIDIDATDRTGHRRFLADRPAGDHERQVRTLAPAVAGRDVIAGIPCVVRRQPLGESYIERCIAEDEDKKLPAWLRFSALSETTPAPDGKTYQWTRTDKVVLNATVDTGVFAPPPGVAIKELK